MTTERRNAVHRRRRIILNDDNGCLHREGADSVDAYLAGRLAHTTESHVDSIWLSVVTGAEQLTYNTRIGEIAGKEPYPGAPKEDLERGRRLWHNLKSMFDQGTDPLRATVEFGHDHDKEVFASFRMNMIQDSWRPDFVTRWKREHSEHCLGVRGSYEFRETDELPSSYWSALDYEQQAVRDWRVTVFEEICTEYDIDGLELDFWRWPAFFKPTLEGRPVADRHIRIMSDFLRRVRKRMLEIETNRGRPLLLAPRVFDTEEICLRMGLDVRTWLEEGLIDILVVGGDYNYYSLPAQDWAELAHTHDVPFYPCTYRSNGLEQDRAFMTYYRDCGADGLYAFNLRMPEDLPSIQEVGDPELIATKDKHYVMNHSVPYITRSHVCAPGLLPVRLVENKPQDATLLVGDDVRRASRDDSLAEMKLHVALINFDPAVDTASFSVNGSRLRVRSTKLNGDRCHFEFIVYTVYTDVRREPPLVKGGNTVQTTLESRSSPVRGPVEIVELDLRVRYQ